jgi:hypothetical protein
MKTKFKKTAQFLFLSFAVLFTGLVAQAQQQGAPRGGQQGPPPLPTDEQIEKMVSNLSTELDLSETQEKQVSALYFAHFEEVEALTGEDDSRPDRKVMEQLKEDFETEVKSVLTKDQQKQYETYLKNQKSQRGGQGKSRQ